MQRQEIELFLSNLQCSESSLPFGPEALVYKVMGKMFALVSQKEEPSRLTLKCAPPDGEVLVAEFESISPGYYMNKKHWITISLTGEVDDEMLKEMMHRSYSLVVDKLKKSDREKLIQGCK